MPSQDRPDVNDPTPNDEQPSFSVRAARVREEARRLATRAVQETKTRAEAQLAKQRLAHSLELGGAQAKAARSVRRSATSGGLLTLAAMLGALAMVWLPTAELASTDAIEVETDIAFELGMPVQTAYAEQELADEPEVVTPKYTPRKPIAKPPAKTPAPPLFDCSGDPNDPLNPCLS